MPSGERAAAKIDYNDYLSNESKGRARSQLKELRPYFDMPGMISFGGGYPHASTWPVNGMTLSVPFAKKSVFVPGYGVPTPDKLLPLADYVRPGKGEALNPDLTVELQYGKTYGAPHLVQWLEEHVRRIHNPPNDNWEVLNTAGNTDGMDGIFRCMFNPGDSMLVEEFAYPGALMASKAQGVSSVGIPMDSDGPLATALDTIMAEWKDETYGCRKPKVLLLVPTCSNPTGYTMPEARKREIYEVCRKWRLMIVEDDPYCFLQIRPNGAASPVIPSFLSMDIDGRVIRVDSFSKIVAPGSRCGWLTGPKQIVTKIMNRSESSTQCPSGFATAAIASVLRAWGGHEGFENEYLPYISSVYEERCVAMMGFFDKHLPKEACEWPQGSGGMFSWLRLKCETHPLLSEKPLDKIVDSLFHACIDELVLTAPSLYFKAPSGKELSKEEESKRIFLRLCYATPTIDELEEGVKRLATAIRREWRL